MSELGAQFLVRENLTNNNFCFFFIFGRIFKKSFFLIATQPFVGLNFLSVKCKKIALPLFRIMGFLL